MAWSLCFAACVGLAFAPTGRGDASVVKADAAIERLIEQLGDRDYRVRQKACTAIEALGTPALAGLQKSRSTPNAEVRRRLEALIASLERTTALTPKRITLHYEKKPIRDVLAEIAKQTGFKIPTTDAGFNGPAGQTLHTFHFDKVPFWEVLDQVCEASGLTLQQTSGNDNLQLTFQDNYEPFKCRIGAFRVMATGFYYNRNTNFGSVSRSPGQPGNQTSESLQLNLTVAVEPRLPILKVGQVVLTAAEDDQKGSMLANVNYNEYPWMWNRYWGGQQRSFFQQTSVNMSWPSKSCQTVRVVKGSIPVTLLAEQRPTVVTEDILSAKGKKFQVGSATFHIEDVSKSGNLYQIKISFSESSTENPWDYSQIQSAQQRIELQDAKGNKYPSYVRSTMFMSPTSAQFQLSTQALPKDSKVGPPAKLIYQLWIKMEHEVPFEFRNLPLP
jgi:hypothetical protein